VPAAEIIDISASLGAGGEEIYDQYADAKLRAVGDLPIPRPAPRAALQARAWIGITNHLSITCHGHASITGWIGASG
jgi:hypothetical protein